METKRNIILVGPMGAGKTTVGRLLAERMGWTFLDTDQMITAASGMEISEIFAEKGEACFRMWEKEAIHDAVGRGEAIISTGGGAVTNPENLAAMKSNGLVVYLRTGIPELLRRVGGGAGRPLLAGEDIREVLTKLLKEREKFYHRADVIVDTDGLTPQEVAERIMRIYEVRKKHSPSEKIQA